MEPTSPLIVPVETPGILGVNPLMLAGPCSFISGSAALPKKGLGRTYTTMYMGMGIAHISVLPDKVQGLEFGVDIMGGASILIYDQTWYDACPG